jgi:hypothetical protein
VSHQVSHPYKTTRKIIVLYVLRQKFLHRMIATIPWFQAAFISFLNRISIRLCCSKIYKLFHPFKGAIISLYILTSPCILISKHNHVLSFISIYF